MALVISPTAGFGNRIRTLCGAIILGKITKRKVYHLWMKNSTYYDDEMNHIKNIKKLGLIEFFDILDCEEFSNNKEINKCYTEWLPGTYWYKYQSFGQTYTKCVNLIKYTNSENIINDKDEYILIESSYIYKPNNITNNEWEILLHDTYRENFKINNKYINLLNDKFENIKKEDLIGICIRRKEFLFYFPEADINLDKLILWLLRLKMKKYVDKKFIVFSDDYVYRDEVRLLTNNNIDFNRTDLLDYKISFMEFIIMATKCFKIYGTKDSSFPKEASIFSNCSYEFIPNN